MRRILRTLSVVLLSVLLFTFPKANGQQHNRATLEKGMNFIETQSYSAEDDARILELYKNLMVADVSDGMDMMGLPGTGLVDPAIHPDWVDLKDFRHIFRGIAVTVRYVPTQKPALPEPAEDFVKWEGNFYNRYSHEAFTHLIRPVSIGGVLVCPGDVVVADGDGVIVVPRSVAEQVAEYASEVLSKDKAGRRSIYESIGRPLDKTVK